MKFKERVDFIKKKKRSGRIDKLALDCIEWAWVEKEWRTEGLSISESSPGTRETRAEELCLNFLQFSPVNLL